MKSNRFSTSGSSNSRKLFLIGFMGAGKSTIGPLLANRLGIPFLDLDERIERRARRSIPEIFQSDGEACFRALETRLLRELYEEPAAVVALGGGCVITPGNWELVRGQGVSVYLACSTEVLASRLAEDDARPVLEQAPGGELVEKISGLLARREPVYRLADLIVTQEKEDTPESIVDSIIQRLRSDR